MTTKRVPDKDLYSILGVTPDATAEQIRDAYIARARVIHPDRFDRNRQPQEWKKANEMLAELNEAYSILRDPSARAQYDQLRAAKQGATGTTAQRSKGDREPAAPLEFELGDLTPGQASFDTLPRKVQLRLLKRQDNKGEDQLQIKLSHVGWNFFFIAVLLCWYWYLFAVADGHEWKRYTLFLYIAITLTVAGLIGRNWVTILRWRKAHLKPYFYVTPLYFIKTEYDTVSFRPIWTLKDISITHNYQNGSYQGSEVLLKFDGHSESLQFSSEKKVEGFLARLRTYDARVRTAYSKGEWSYFLENDDFYGVRRSPVAPKTNLVPRATEVFIYALSVTICAGGLLVAMSVNKQAAERRWVHHPAPTTSALQGPPRVPEASPHRPQPMPLSGKVRTWTTEERVAPFEIDATQGRNCLVKLVDAYRHAPVMDVFVRSGTIAKVEVPLGDYEVRYACGETWYGYGYLFGPETAYGKANKTFTFNVVGDEVTGFRITLYKVPHGNLATSPIEASEF